ncbi:chemotaxis protein CheW [Ekhidna sp.]|uniref:chemotaxis protein CheW n=1 Tax=Ekhidna sp. TaxID=2608089 RepID=UPI003BABB307
MALGKNLKKKKLIPSEEEVKPAKPKRKSKPVQKQTKLIAKKKPIEKSKARKQPKKPTVKTKPKVKEPEIEVAKTSSFAIPSYIASELNEKKKVLRERYKQEIQSIKGHELQFVSFEIGKETYAVGIEDVKEVVPLPKLSETPNTPKHIKGLANVRGSTYVVFDLAKRFNLMEEREPVYLLILNSTDIKAGLILPVLPSTFKSNGNLISSELQLIEDASLDVSYIKGIIQQQEKLIFFLDAIEMLKNDKAVVVPDQLINEGK